MSEKYSLYGAPLSLYTGKARAYLAYKQIPFKEVFSTVKVYKNIIIPKTGVRFIPVVKTPQDEYLQDTTHIIETLEARHTHRPVIPKTPKQKLVSHLFEMWADEWLLLPAMHYRWNKDNFPFIYEQFGSVVFPTMPNFIKAFVGKRIGAKFRGFVPMLGITSKSIPAIEDWYENHVLPLLNTHFAKHDYLLGSAASLGDFCLMGPLYAHLYRDPAPGKIMREKARHVANWVERMNSNTDAIGEWLPNDDIPDTLLPLLKRLFLEYWPVATHTADALSEWVKNNPNTADIPRSIGSHDYTIGGVHEQRAIITFQVYKLQRVLSCYQGLAQSEKASVDELLASINAGDAIHYHIVNPVKRENNKLVLA